tara:strand:- start:1613 stop:2032 length:420 start_codon:yes stop_codon:yes gene_type:complete
MFLKALLFSMAAHAGEPPQFTILGENEPAPFEGVLFNKRGIAELLVMPEEYRMGCDLEIEYQLDVQATEFHLERQNFQIRLDALTREYDLRIEQKDIEIVALQEAMLNQSPSNKLWWFAGGVAAGIATTYAAYRMFNER